MYPDGSVRRAVGGEGRLVRRESEPEDLIAWSTPRRGHSSFVANSGGASGGAPADRHSRRRRLPVIGSGLRTLRKARSRFLGSCAEDPLPVIRVTGSDSV